MKIKNLVINKFISNINFILSPIIFVKKNLKSICEENLFYVANN